MKRVFTILVLVIVGWVVAHAATLLIDGHRYNLGQADVVVVLGNKVELDGQPSDRLRARLRSALELYTFGYADNIIVSGGVGKEGFDEAQVMADYLVAAGVEREVIIVDSDGYDSYMTAQNATRIMREEGWESALIVSQWFHLTRTRHAFKRFGVSEIYTARAYFREWRDIKSVIREIPGFYYYLVRSYETEVIQ